MTSRKKIRSYKLRVSTVGKEHIQPHCIKQNISNIPSWYKTIQRQQFVLDTYRSAEHQIEQHRKQKHKSSSNRSYVRISSKNHIPLYSSS